MLHQVKDRRSVVHYRWRLVEGDETLELIGKSRFTGLDISGIDSQQQLYHASAGCKCLRLARPVAVIAKWNAWLQEALPGKPLDDLLTPASPTEPLRRVGRALAEFHDLQTQPPRRHTFADELRILEESLDRVRRKRAKRRRALDEIAFVARARMEEVGEAECVGLHRDFYPAQVLYDGGRVGIIDCDLHASGHPAIDVGNFVAHLQEKALRRFGDYRAMKPHEEAFFEGYRELRPCDRSARRILTAVSLARHIYISRRIKSRRSITKRLISIVQKQLEKA